MRDLRNRILDLIGGQGSTEEISLHEVAAQSPQCFELRRRFDALGDNRELERFREGHDRLDDARVLGFAADPSMKLRSTSSTSTGRRFR